MGMYWVHNEMSLVGRINEVNHHEVWGHVALKSFLGEFPKQFTGNPKLWAAGCGVQFLGYPKPNFTRSKRICCASQRFESSDEALHRNHPKPPFFYRWGCLKNVEPYREKPVISMARPGQGFPVDFPCLSISIIVLQRKSLNLRSIPMGVS